MLDRVCLYRSRRERDRATRCIGRGLLKLAWSRWAQPHPARVVRRQVTKCQERLRGCMRPGNDQGRTTGGRSKRQELFPHFQQGPRPPQASEISSIPTLRPSPACMQRGSRGNNRICYGWLPRFTCVPSHSHLLRLASPVLQQRRVLHPVGRRGLAARGRATRYTSLPCVLLAGAELLQPIDQHTGVAESLSKSKSADCRCKSAAQAKQVLFIFPN
jgi:hypothetical protein